MEGAAPQAGGMTPAAEAASTPTEGASTEVAPKAKAQEAAEEYEEVALGSLKGKLPKSFAKAVKDLERGFHSKAQESAQMKRQFQAQLEQFKANPDAFFETLGISAEEFAESRLARKLEEMAMSPEQRELAELKAWKAEQEKIRQEAEEKEKAAKEEANLRQVMEQTDQEIAKAWKEAGLPQDIFFVKQMAAIMRESAIMVKRGEAERPLTAEQAASIVKERLFKQLAPIVRQLGPEGILSFLGDETWKTVREWDVARATGKAAKTSPGQSSPGPKPASANAGQINPKAPMNEAAWRKYISEIA